MSGLDLPGAPDASRDGDGSNRNATPDIFQQLLRQRIVFLGRAVDDELANSITAQLLYLEGQDPKRDIWLYINSPGGSITSGMAIYDTMQFVTPDVGTICMGLGASMAQFLLCAGAAGKRYALPHARILMHQPHGGVQGQASDIAIQAEQMTYIKQVLAERISEHTGQPVDQVEADFDRDRWFTAEQAKEYGIIDEVIAERGAIR
ncbi:MAG: ATP-dependent Clp protease proteolytic subunit [bacterium]|nr:ATP-dependent Clp protease proteolytic subunit [bacterium]